MKSKIAQDAPLEFLNQLHNFLPWMQLFDEIEGLLEAFVSRTPLGRVGEPQEVAAVVAFLCLPASSHDQPNTSCTIILSHHISHEALFALV
uniref:Uncharacterized protein n=1 Tax=Kalanchoe fedtschenkoi TaxID=63787 RepID=A0A7N0ZYN9_KALFE